MNIAQQQQVIEWIQADNQRMTALRYARNLGLNQWCLAAGFVRNRVWDSLHNYHQATPLNDIDLVYFDRENCSAERDKWLESHLLTQSPLPWSVKNQARMHLRSGRPPYASTQDAISYWVEIETAIGVRLEQDDTLTLIAPFGLHALFDSTITFNPKNGDLATFHQRVAEKGWLIQWPNLYLSHDAKA
ncbi:nucleotidyltransferase family protein [Yersinia ruckeri]|uniref:nucleotidyltransferase family protein n=1 Tax=Yersinia ruckeri TaxID=29486 RepID=UPI000B2ED846|nr:nucleotidyltransferase family protein [Yersinia ruckeri]